MATFFFFINYVVSQSHMLTFTSQSN